MSDGDYSEGDYDDDNEESEMDDRSSSSSGSEVEDLNGTENRNLCLSGNSRKTKPILFEYEYVKVWTVLADMISDNLVGVPAQVLSTCDSDTSIDLAKRWIECNKTCPLPFLLKRSFQDGTFETWNLAEMITPEQLEFYKDTEREYSQKVEEAEKTISKTLNV